MKYKDFTDFLTYKFGVEEPAVLDDDWPDRFNDWLADLDVDTLVKWADEYAKERVEDVNLAEPWKNEIASLRSMLGRAGDVLKWYIACAEDAKENTSLLVEAKQVLSEIRGEK